MLYHFEKGWKVAQSWSDLNRRWNSQPEPNKEWNLLLRSPHSPAETPMDYHVNRPLKIWPTNRISDEVDGLMADVKAWIASKNQNFLPVEPDCLANGKRSA
ncbi:unnamed protein product [Haemonchus placei]|uniref:DUF4160 domain-containing protein n=1 Tax=Haemonchus placei TaxID=6290 RepID=A0A0N4WKH3_HAEPC|nr:unnamed protein product [Haemonchus placei]